MSLKEKFKKHTKLEFKKISEMSRKDKFWYIWEYYKIHIIGTTLLLFMVFSIGISIYGNRFDNVLSCIIINGKLEDEGFETLEQGINNYLEVDPKKETLYLDTSMYVNIDQPTEYSYSCLAKISALTASKDLDVMISDPTIINHFGQLGAFVDLETFLPEDMLIDLKDRLYYCVDSQGNTKAYGLSMEDAPMVTESGLQLTSPLMGILGTSIRQESTIEFIRYAFGL